MNKRLLRLILVSLVLVLVLTGISPRVAQADPGWYDSSWAYRKKITINSSNVTANLTNFPLLISLSSDTDLAADAQDDGDDILFTAADETTKLSHDIEKFDGNNGELVVWVKIPSLSSSVDTEIYMYYGNAGASNQEDATNVWDSSYKMVQHLQETTGGANAIKDSTSNANHGTDSGAPTLGATGKVDNAIGFDGTNDYIDHGTDGSLDITANITIEAWIYPTANMTNNAIVAKEHQTNGLQYALFIYTGGAISFQVHDGTAWKRATGGTPSLNAWHHVVGVYDQSNVKVYLDTSATVGDAYSGSITSTTANVSIGDYYTYDGTYAFTGTIDEVRISDTARSSDWIQTSYNNQNSPSNFYNTGSEETGTATIAVGGEIFPINKARVMAPYLILALVIALVIARGELVMRRLEIAQVGSKKL